MNNQERLAWIAMCNMAQFQLHANSGRVPELCPRCQSPLGFGGMHASSNPDCVARVTVLE